MQERYEKAGRVFRVDVTFDGVVESHFLERGVATSESGSFFARSLPLSAAKTPVESEAARQIVRKITALISPPLSIERLVVTAGESQQRCVRGDDDRTWNECIVRLHLSIAHRGHRVRTEIDLSAADAALIDLDVVERAVSMLAGMSLQAGTPDRVMLLPNVCAALNATIASSAEALARSGVSLQQEQHESFLFDGRGEQLQRMALTSGQQWPNVFRPSYRLPPVAMPFHVAMSSEVEPANDAPIVAAALLEPFTIREGWLTARLLSTHPVEVRIPIEQLGRRLHRISADRKWFPYAAGAWGTNTILEL